MLAILSPLLGSSRPLHTHTKGFECTLQVVSNFLWSSSPALWPYLTSKHLLQESKPQILSPCAGSPPPNPSSEKGTGEKPIPSLLWWDLHLLSKFRSHGGPQPVGVVTSSSKCHHGHARETVAMRIIKRDLWVL